MSSFAVPLDMWIPCTRGTPLLRGSLLMYLSLYTSNSVLYSHGRVLRMAVEVRLCLGPDSGTLHTRSAPCRLNNSEALYSIPSPLMALGAR